MMRPFLLSLLFALVTATGVHAVEQDIYNPLAVGLKWEVDVEMKWPGGKEAHGTAVREIVGTVTVNENTYFVVNTSFQNLPKLKDFTYYRRKAARGIFAVDPLDKTKTEYLESILPLTLGQQWRTEMQGALIFNKVEAIESLKLGDKTYDKCIKVSYSGARGVMAGVYYQAPDVGNVLEKTTIEGAAVTFTLKNFSGLK